LPLESPPFCPQIKNHVSADVLREGEGVQHGPSGRVWYGKRCLSEESGRCADVNWPGSAGIAELMLFHPVDTIAKRLMSNESRITSSSQLNQVIFKDKAGAGIRKKFFSLFPGLGYAGGYKVLQRIYKYGGQPVARDYLSTHYGRHFEEAFGKKTGKAIMHSTAGRYVTHCSRAVCGVRRAACGPQAAENAN
jgi:hypothetical protein